MLILNGQNCSLEQWPKSMQSPDSLLSHPTERSIGVLIAPSEIMSCSSGLIVAWRRVILQIRAERSRSQLSSCSLSLQLPDKVCPSLPIIDWGHPRRFCCSHLLTLLWSQFSCSSGCVGPEGSDQWRLQCKRSLAWCLCLPPGWVTLLPYFDSWRCHWGCSGVSEHLV